MASGLIAEALRQTKGAASPPLDIGKAASMAASPAFERPKDWASFAEQRASLQSELPV
jgi:hypothetical protein